MAISEPDLEVAAAAMNLLADRNRLRLIGCLMQREQCVGDLVAALAIPQPLASFHLRVLREQGLVRVRRRARWSFYSLDANAWNRFTDPIWALTWPRPHGAEAADGAATDPSDRSASDRR